MSDNNECCICFESIHPAHYDKTCCLEYLQKYNDGKDNQLHPLKRTPMLKCKCGKIWNQDCAILGISKNAYTIDISSFEGKTPKERREMVTNPKYMIKLDNNKHGLIKN